MPSLGREAGDVALEFGEAGLGWLSANGAGFGCTLVFSRFQDSNQRRAHLRPLSPSPIVAAKDPATRGLFK
ncbi:hypothetical protein BDP81DRAFT_402868 [Colletotrichum phormii]|uniref:Uncharacterized protein n=1 Tax=Colletotrichum phormii TaxID=359342 RepID=A0AAJ0A4H9_9PEZI|nr:uncharacterized protein BDP81DRAFT_402868 [Colletotrichum phormii]KAK1654926.1 hypothetical protein BDP81DRAFT_402868 [Colletotrichum phormii]